MPRAKRKKRAVGSQAFAGGISIGIGVGIRIGFGIGVSTVIGISISISRHAFACDRTPFG